MVRACIIISESLRAVLSEENRTCIFNSVKIIKWIVYAKLKMLGSYCIGYFYALFYIVGNDYFAVVLY